MIASEVCKTFEASDFQAATAGLKEEFSEEVIGSRRPSANQLQHSLYWMMRDLGLPGNEYARIVRVKILVPYTQWRVSPALFLLQVDNGTYRQWEGFVAVCGCESRHVLRTDFVPAEEWVTDPYEVSAD